MVSDALPSRQISVLSLSRALLEAGQRPNQDSGPASCYCGQVPACPAAFLAALKRHRSFVKGILTSCMVTKLSLLRSLPDYQVFSSSGAQFTAGIQHSCLSTMCVSLKCKNSDFVTSVKREQELQRSEEAVSLHGAAALFKEPEQQPQSIFGAPERTKSFFPIFLECMEYESLSSSCSS